MKYFISNLSHSSIINTILWIAFFIPFIIYSIFIFRYAVNIPYQDDYDVVLNFINTFIQMQTLEEKTALLFSQHNEHRIVFDRIVFLCYYYLFHEVNFIFFIIFGNLGWLLTIITLILYLKNNSKFSFAYLLPIPYILLLPVHHENMFFAMAAIQNYWFIFFVVIFLICLSKDKKILFFALFPIALFTSGGGIILYLLGNLFLLLRKKWQSLALFFILSTYFMVLYFHGYDKPPYHPDIFETALNPLRATVYFFTFLGNIFIVPLSELSLLTGFILCALSAYFIFIKQKEDDYFWKLVICFVVLITLTTTLTRSGFGIRQAVVSRYSLFPLLVLVCVYVFIISSISNTAAAYRIILIFAISFWVINAFLIERNHFFLKMKETRISSIVAFSHGDKTSLLYPNQDRAAQILLTAERQHVYSYQDQIP